MDFLTYMWVCRLVLRLLFHTGRFSYFDLKRNHLSPERDRCIWVKAGFRHQQHTHLVGFCFTPSVKGQHDRGCMENGWCSQNRQLHDEHCSYYERQSRYSCDSCEYRATHFSFGVMREHMGDFMAKNSGKLILRFRGCKYSTVDEYDPLGQYCCVRYVYLVSRFSDGN